MLRKTVLVRALQIAFSGAAVAMAVTTPVMAQSNASGNINGSVETPAGSSIVVVNKETGLRRTTTPEANGRYQLTALPVGRYTVQLLRDGKVENTLEVDVNIGQGVDASFSSKVVQSVQVTGRRSRIDLSNTNSGATFTAKELAKLPVTPSVASIIQLAPNTTRGDSRYGDGNAPSFGGSAASENAFYINGFPVTNVLFQVGSSELPFGSIGQAQVLTGGFGAEFGRSTGGVINISTKSGTNNWEAGGSYSIEPNSMRASARNIYYPKTGSSSDGKIYYYNQDNERTQKIGNVFVGGPIIKDKLFVYANVEQTRTDMSNTRLASSSATAGNVGWEERDDKTNRALVKVDWNINDNHRLEGTYIKDDPKSDRSYYGFNYGAAASASGIAPLSHGTVKNGGAYYESYGPTPVAARVGAEIKILNYTGNLSDDVTLTAMIGNSKTDHVFRPFNYNPDIFQISAPPESQIPGIAYVGGQTVSGNLLTEGAFDEQKVMSLNLQYKIGDHTIRVGMDKNDISSKAGTSRAGGGTWVYEKSDDPTQSLGPNILAPATNGGYGAQGYYVVKTLVSGVSTPTVNQQAQYIEDSWQVTKDILIKAGLRNEQFTNYNGDGQAYVSMRHQLAPRLGATWDVLGDNSLKVFGNAGRYHLQMPTNVAVRAAGASLYTQQYYTYSGVDANGSPTGLQQLSGVTSVNNEFGQSKDPRTVAANNMDSLYQDELILGFERAYSPNLNFGAKLTYRTLKSGIDDFCDSRPFQAWGVAHGIEGAEDFSSNCFLFNPGKDNEFNVDYGTGTLTKVHLTAAELGYPEVKRTYTALDLFVEHPLRNGWYGKINYTLSRNKGNTEGQTRSDSGQADVSTTAVWDMPELSLYANGLLPNDRKHQIKAYGYYQFTDELSVGGNLLLASGRPKNCIGNLPDSYYDAGNPATGYDSEFFFCNGQPSPRGSLGRMPWDIRLDANVAYSPSFLKGLVLKADVFNVFNRQAAQNQTETYNSGNTVNPLYGGVISYTAPRSVKLTAEYNYRF